MPRATAGSIEKLGETKENIRKSKETLIYKLLVLNTWGNRGLAKDCATNENQTKHSKIDLRVFVVLSA